jgi:hypothetical protein
MPNIIYSDSHPAEGKPSQGTLFPEMGGGGSPGDAEAGDDITGIVLKGLSDPDNTPAPAHDGGTLSLAPAPPLEGAPAAPAPVPGMVVEDTTPQPEQGRPKTAQQRIAQLTHKYRSAEKEKGEVETQLSQVLDVMKAQGQELAELRGTLARPLAGAAVPQDKPDDILGLPGAQPSPTRSVEPTTGVPMTPDTLKAIVTDAITIYDQGRRNEESARTRTVAAQEQSFQVAAAEMPELRDARTRAHQIFSELYKSSPLAALDDGPYQIALQVRGIMADEKADSAGADANQVQEDRLRHATLPPQPSQIPQGNRAVMLKEYNDIVAERKRGNEDFNLYKRLRYLREALRQPQR